MYKAVCSDIEIPDDGQVVMIQDQQGRRTCNFYHMFLPKAGFWRNGVLFQKSKDWAGLQMADLVAYSVNRNFFGRKRINKGRPGPFDNLIVDTVEKLVNEHLLFILT